MRFIKKSLLLFIIFFTALFLSFEGIHSDESSDKLKDIQEKIEEYQEKIDQLKGQQKTLSSAITYLDSKINLTIAEIAKTEGEITLLEEEIAKLSVKIEQLDKTLNEISKILTSRIGATYKSSHVQPGYLLLSSKSFSSFFTRVKYLKIAQTHDRQILFQMEQQKQNFDEQKSLKEEKQEQMEDLKKTLEAQEATLAQQKKAKQELLEITKNDEKKFQGLLATARAEMEAIQSIIAGKGEEVQVGEIKKGERIASIISGQSSCSTGTHLHFEAVKSGAHQNPASFLKNISVIWDNAPDGQFSFSGSWDWPMDEPIRVTQGYGMTYWAGLGWYGGGPHTGIDVASESSDNVKAVQDGVLYRGSIACGGGTLRYVKVGHQDDIDTYYLHINYY